MDGAVHGKSWISIFNTYGLYGSRILRRNLHSPIDLAKRLAGMRFQESVDVLVAIHLNNAGYLDEVEVLKLEGPRHLGNALWSMDPSKKAPS